jgi:hypothetical protein
VVTNVEYRLKLIDFHFIWDVQIDGVVFGDAGRVFYSDGDIASELGQPVATIPATSNDFRYSYGGGTRIAPARRSSRASTSASATKRRG